MTAARLLALPLVLLAAACTAEPVDDDRAASPTASTAGTGTSVPAATSPPPTSGTTAATPSTAPDGVDAVDGVAAMAVVRELAGGGPREATSPAYGRAVELVRAAFAARGYDVELQRFTVPAGESWGVPVPRGRTSNVVARPAGFDSTAPHVVVGAHLDTVPQSPGAEDNASGVAVLLELARLAGAHGSRLPVVLVAFGAEEPRGSGDDEHHFGSQVYLRRSAAAESNARVAMVSLDRVGAPGRVPVCTGGLGPRRVQRALLTAAGAAGVPARRCENRTSDHWPFEKAGEAVARVGGNPSPGYHSPRDLPRQVSRRQLERVGAVLWQWLAPPA